MYVYEWGAQARHTCLTCMPSLQFDTACASCMCMYSPYTCILNDYCSGYFLKALELDFKLCHLTR
eukprot:m.78791 g.78791  ORF g.78791 m.78791 type:complete len:65 (-) comp12544_c0_seq2:1345-1539(-)